MGVVTALLSSVVSFRWGLWKRDHQWRSVNHAFNTQELQRKTSPAFSFGQMPTPGRKHGRKQIRLDGHKERTGFQTGLTKNGKLAEPRELRLSLIKGCCCYLKRASQVALVVKNPPANAGEIRDASSIPGLGRSQGGHGNPLQYSCLENPMDRGARRAAVHGFANSRTWLSHWAHAI